MFIGVIGTRYSGKTTVVEYLKTRGFTVLKLRSGDGINDEDTSTAASSDDANGNQNLIIRDATISLNESSNAGPSAQPVAVPATSGTRVLDSLADLSGPTPKDEPDSLDWMRSRTPESHLHRDEQKEDQGNNNIPSTSHFPGTSHHPVVSSLRFNNHVEMLDYATKNWQSHFVTEDLPTYNREALDPFLKRPFFLLVEVDAPLLVRLARAGDISLEQLVEEHDTFMYGPPPDPIAPPHLPPASRGARPPHAAFHYATPHHAHPPPPDTRFHHALRKLANVTIINSSRTLEDLWRSLDELDLTNGERLRPRWDTYFMRSIIPGSAAPRPVTIPSQSALYFDRSAILGAHDVVYDACFISIPTLELHETKGGSNPGSTYNGTPRGLTNCNEGGCARCNGKAKSGEALDECLCLHAEENALLEAGRERVGDGEGAVLYCNTCPCLRCSVKIVQTGVREVVYNLAYSMDAAAADVFVAAGVTLRQHTP